MNTGLPIPLKTTQIQGGNIQSFQGVKMTETAFTRELQVSLRSIPSVLVQKHSDRFTAGIADLEIVYNGQVTWIEVKDLSKLKSLKDFDLVGSGKNQVTKLQEKFLTDRIKAGIRAFGIFKIENKLAAMIPGNRFSDLGMFNGWLNTDKINGIWQLERFIK